MRRCTTAIGEKITVKPSTLMYREWNGRLLLFVGMDLSAMEDQRWLILAGEVVSAVHGRQSKAGGAREGERKREVEKERERSR